MHYIQFQIRNFKGIEKIEIDLDRKPRSPVFALVGLNESGKTTILEAIHWLYNDQRIDPEDLIPRSMLASFNGSVAVEAALGLSEDDKDRIDHFLWKKCSKFKLEKPIDEVRVKRVYEYEDSLANVGELLWTFPLEGKTKRAKIVRNYASGDDFWDRLKKFVEIELYPPIIYYENFLFDFPDRLYLAGSEHEGPDGSTQLMPLDDKQTRYKAVVQDVLSSFERPLSVERHLVENYKRGKNRPLEAALNGLSSSVTKKVFDIWQELLKFDDASGMEISFGQDLKKDDTGYYLEVTVKEEDQSYLIRERSLGFRWFFAFFMFTIFRAFRYKQEVKALFLLDEPASNLHSTAQKKLLNVFEQIPNKQTIIYATHSHHMIDPKWLSGTFVVKNEALRYEDIGIGYSSYKTRISAIPYFHFAATYPGDTDYFKPILDSIDYQPSHLELVPDVIIVEGKNDFYTIKFAKDLGYVSSALGDHVAPGTGKDTLKCLIALYLAWAKRFVVFLDDDSGGRETHKQLKAEFGSSIDGKAFRLNHADKRFKGLPMEGVFVKRDQLNLIKTVFPGSTTFDKEQFNIALQHNYFNSNKVELSEHTVNRLQIIFDFLERAIDKQGELNS